MRLLEEIEPLLPSWLDKQRWFSTSEGENVSAKIVDSEVLRTGWPRLLWTLVEVGQRATYQVPLGIRPRELMSAELMGNTAALIGDVDVDGERSLLYDALIDPELNQTLFALIVGDKERAETVRVGGAEQTNTSLIFDNRLVLKIFRRLYEGPNPDLEVTLKLTEAGFAHIKPVIAAWERVDHDLAVCQPFIADGADGWKLALASVRDFLRHDGTGDFGDEAHRLGQVTGELHVVLADVFPNEAFDPSTIASSLESGISSISPEQVSALRVLIERLRDLRIDNCGHSVRIHGDFHLGQTLRADSGWYVMDFEGEPVRPISERILPNSPLKDVAGMIRSFHYATAVGVAADGAEGAAAGWEWNNRKRFTHGYFSVDGISGLLPADEEVTQLLLRAFEIEKAIYELNYERAYRPDWVSIPESAIARLLG